MSTRIDAQGLRDADREVLAHSVASDYFATLKMPLAARTNVVGVATMRAVKA